MTLLVWSGQELLTRGESLSAHLYLTGFAVDSLLQLLRRYGELSDDRCRLERLAPAVSAELERILGLPLTHVGAALLTLAEQRVRPVAPDLN